VSSTCVILAIIFVLVAVVSLQPTPSLMGILLGTSFDAVIVVHSLEVSVLAAVVLLLPAQACANQHGRTSVLIVDALQ
jgi:hypothetical protein